ncbi:MAG: YceI family protein [Candidatus Thiodiazotropha sp. (ex Gloverina cf. vestifex)]|nr:YceI family protein [Candidatus Thiodiazotropha sp. (ex Gloverina cf. vestifex)]
MIYSIRMVVFFILSVFGAVSASASDYLIDTEGSHAFIQFRISHLGYSWLTGRFNRFSGEFSYDENDPASPADRHGRLKAEAISPR